MTTTPESSPALLALARQIWDDVAAERRAGVASPAGTLTAVRTRKGAKATVTVYLDGVELAAAGGKRAERAAAAVVTHWATEGRTDKGPGLYGLRADLGAAQTEARKLATATTMRHRGAVLPVTPAAWAVAVPVVNA